MVRRSKTRRVLRWGGTLASAAAVTLWLASIRAPGWALHGHNSLGVESGRLVLNLQQRREEPGGYSRLSLPSWERRHPNEWSSLRSYGFVLPAVRRWHDPLFRSRGAGTYVTCTQVVVPCWLLLLATAVPTTISWWRHRGIPPGHCCTCGYNLTGNVSGRCPECGTPCPQQTTTSQ